jgi:tripartite-type tricarboxylate transporter receptor subunit TctC
MKLRHVPILCGLIAMSLTGSVAQAQAQAFPNRMLTLSVAVPPGGALDFVARLVSKEMTASLGQQVIVENTPGAGGTLGTNKAMRAPADGHTMMLSSPVEVILAPLAYNAAQYKAEDMRTIRIVGHTGVMVVVRKGLAANNLSELVTLMKASADKPLTYCSPGNGSLYHLIGERFNNTAGVKSIHVPYSGFPQCMTDLVGANIDFAFLPLAGPFPGAVDSGGIRAIAMLSNTPSARFPKVPVATATPGFEKFTFSIWSAIQVNAKVPEAAAEALNQHVNAALAKPDVRAAIEQSGSVVSPSMTLKQAQDEYLREIALYTAMYKAVGLPKQ